MDKKFITYNLYEFVYSSLSLEIRIIVRQFNREGRRALRVGPLAEAVVVVESLMGTGGGA